jgi:putative PLP-dependent aminotransferase (TIGR04422 family)
VLDKNRNGVWGERKNYKFSFATATPTKIESLLAEKFLGGYPVVLSSGRSAIKLLVQEFWMARELAVFQYASQCVVEAIQAAGVIPLSRTNLTSDIVYNQWGNLDIGCITTPFIEDSCDTFLPTGSTTLRLGAQFEVWSLPKILNSRFGAVVWCRNLEDAEHLIGVRDASKRGIIKKQFLRNFRNLSRWNYRIWQTSEFQTYSLSKFEYGNLFKDVVGWNKTYRERKELMQSSFKLLSAKYFDYLDTQKEIAAEALTHALPVLTFELNNQNFSLLEIDENFQIMHEIESGKKPKKVMVYKFLQKGSLK